MNVRNFEGATQPEAQHLLKGNAPHRGLLGFCLAIFIFSLFLFTRGNDFSFIYHIDEKGKVEQIQSGDWNFNHPMLMLSSARLVTFLTGQQDNMQYIAEIGRWVSAFFAAAAVALLSATFWLRAGAMAGIIVGILLAGHHSVFEYAHYFKEDPSLMLGLSAWIFAVGLFQREPSKRNALLVGVGAALAVSGKYIGAITVVTSPLLMWAMLTSRAEATGIPNQPDRKHTHEFTWLIGAFFIGVVIPFVIINLPLVTSLNHFSKSLQGEMVQLVNIEGSETVRDVPHLYYTRHFSKMVFVAMWPFIALHIFLSWKNRKKTVAFDWLIILFPIIFAIILSFSAKVKDRYFLPCALLFLCMAAQGVAQAWVLWTSGGSSRFKEILSSFHKGSLRHILSAWLILLALGVTLGWQGNKIRKFYGSCVQDDRADLIAWLNEHLPTAAIAQSSRVKLPTELKPDFLPYQPKLKTKVMNTGFDGSESLESLRAAGATHVVIAGGRKQEAVAEKDSDEKDTPSGADGKKAFYDSIRRQGTLLWFRPKVDSQLRPGLEVYALPKP